MIPKIQQRLRQLTQVDIQPHWHHYRGDLPIDELPSKILAIAPLNEKGYIIWPRSAEVCILVQKIVIPPSLKDYPLQGSSLRLALTWWADRAEVFVQDKLVQVGDLFESSVRVLLTPSAQVGREITVVLRLVSPKHDVGALMRSQLIYEKPDLDPGFVADELTVLENYLTTFAPEHLSVLTQAVAELNWDHVDNAAKFAEELRQLREKIFPLSAILKQRSLNLLGHAHLDLAWLWPVSETWSVAQKTFESVLNLQQEFPELTFCHTSPALYSWVEQHCPDLFKAIQKAEAAQRWEVLGGMWVEPEVNLVSGESLVRQLLYGQNYIKAKFGKISAIAWLPDSFGFTWQLPQILQQSGINYFVTGKLHWNDTTKFPHGLFWWCAPDGTAILTLMSPPNVAGVMDTNPISLSNYAISWEQQTGLQDAFWLPGVGDHGGGPTRDMLLVAQRWQASPFFPEIKFTQAQTYLSQIANSPQLPIWQDELYLEFHRGCYTTHADQKSYNRRCENWLYQAELWSFLACLIQSDYIYPKIPLASNWQKVLFNQFHDILPGTSIPEVFLEANQDWQEVEKVSQEMITSALRAIASQVILPSPPHPQAQPILVFNSLNWERSEVVAVSVISKNWIIYDLEGNELPSQVIDSQLLFFATSIPAIGYRLFWLVPSSRSSLASIASQTNWVLENELLRVEIDSETGDIKSLFDRQQAREILRAPGNQLQAYQDQGQYWDAWNIDPQYENFPLPPTHLKSIQMLANGPLEWCIRIVRQLNNSEFIQDYILHTHSPILKIKTTVHWQETHVIVKAAFPLNWENDFTHYEIPCGVIARSNRPQTPSEKAKWEVPALRWADLSAEKGDYGLSLLNDCKYGYDSNPFQLRLSLLRSSTWPDSQADIGTHQFTYAVYPHQGTWKNAHTVHKGYELNIPLIVLSNLATNESPHLPPIREFLNLNADNLIVMALKQSEADENLGILRFYEAYGQNAEIMLTGDLGLKLGQQTNILEQTEQTETTIIPKVNPWKIVSHQIWH